MDIRNIAIIAHVDHGKTTITDAIMKQTGAAGQDDSMDSNALEKERGITIYAKNTSIVYKDTKINIVDTPGHADFGSEVERVLRAIDSVVLVVDAQEGPMPQTRFVLKKSLELGHKPMVVINKIDKPAARLGEVEDEIFELFLELGATDEQLEFPIIYSIGKQGIAKNKPEDNSSSMEPLLDMILEHVPAAKNDMSVPLRLQPFSLAYDDYLGRLAVARIYEGVLKMEPVFIKSEGKETRKGKIIKMFSFEGTKRKEVSEAVAGDIVMIAGIDDIDIGETICAQENAEALPAITVDEPTIALEFLVNSSPFAGKEGEFVTREQIRERLKKELEINVGLKVDFTSDNFTVYGRGELHVAVLLENMRREGFEVQVSQPRVIIKEVDGTKMEPFEELTVTVPSEFSGNIIEKLGKRKGIMTDMKQATDGTRMLFEIPTRGALGYRNEFIVDTRGEGILSSRFLEFRPYVGEIKKRAVGSMISGETGKALGFSLFNLQQRGTLYIGASQDVYAGQVIGNTSKGDEMTVNPIKGKHLTNMRASGSDDAINLVPPIEITIEKGLEIMAEDEYLEITPKNVRLRKHFLTEADRVRAGRKN
ncbi:MAG: translational GTPase TypA, partial [Candidatus Moranbacteria bacterium]|nr:translational GTPase TypA [Candidatus Moranbacteria bacterium]